MRPIFRASVHRVSRPFYLLGVTAFGVLLAAACGGRSEDHTAPASGAAGGAAAASSASGRAGTGSVGSAGSGADVAGNSAASESAGAAGADASEAGAAGAPAEVAACEPGGTAFVVGNYRSATGEELFLRSTVSAMTIALVSKAPAVSAKPPQLFAVERLCAGGSSLIARDDSAHYRVDFSRRGSQVALCISAPITTLDLAAGFPPADRAHMSDTGCAGQPFSVYTAELP